MAHAQVILINRVLTYHARVDAFGRPVATLPTEQWWVSFYDREPKTGVYINRGWWLLTPSVLVYPCNSGWMVEDTSTGRVVIAPVIERADSTVDLELQRRKIVAHFKWGK